jgi:hypothetical protein
MIKRSSVRQKMHPEQSRQANGSCYLRLKQDVLTHYGNGKCACVRCGFEDMRALSIDHINGGGNNFRKQNKLTSSYCFYGWLIRNNYPEGHQTLCMNCQTIKRKENNEFGKYEND